MKPISTAKSLAPGTIIRRIGNNKDQQGSFLKYDAKNNMILANIIDMETGSLVASEGVLKPQPADKLYYYASSFSSNPASDKALKVVKSWPLYKKHGDLQDKIINFVRITYVPEQIIDMSKRDCLQSLFVPIQQKFRIGRFTENRGSERVCNDIFMLWLESINIGKHLTYLAQVTKEKGQLPIFYSAGAKTHEETANLIQNEIFTFEPNLGGHIKYADFKNGTRHFIVDAGSKYMGVGSKTPLAVSKMVAGALKKLYPDFDFTPLKGRGAIGE
ncbi:MAG: hypothetical protein A2W19_09000 [Spirochaetes bacterium RBG_16_49_21]|nr:MAG: hypothetical protein A2W19_09000 [Spirochaetes bacterium RBG_16_49_21]